MAFNKLRKCSAIKFITSFEVVCKRGLSHKELKSSYDVVVIGAGHNGLVAAAYMQKAGLDVGVFERREVIGGASITEEIVPGFKFSRASYVLSLLRPIIKNELELEKHGLKVHIRDPSSFTPVLQEYCKTKTASHLLLGLNRNENVRQIAKFSAHDAAIYGKYETFLEEIVNAIDVLYDLPPVSMDKLLKGSLKEKLKTWPSIVAVVQSVKKLGKNLPQFVELMSAPAIKIILDKWFESDVLKATLATDAVIGSQSSPYMPGSGYVLLHHVMGEAEGISGAWGYVEGGMGSVAAAIAKSATSYGASIFCDSAVKSIIVDTNTSTTKGIVLEDGTEIAAKVVLSNATPYITYSKLIPDGTLSKEMLKDVKHFDYASPVAKINAAVNQLPNFTVTPNERDGRVGPQHKGTIHLNCENPMLIHDAFEDVQKGLPSKRPVIEMCIPSALDSTVAPEGAHVISLFTQYVPYQLPQSADWTIDARNDYAKRVFNNIDEYAPGFSKSVIGYEVLTPIDLERIFGLTGGNIFHGALSVDQLYFNRMSSNTNESIQGLYICGSGAHPGGGVSGAPGRIAALEALSYVA